MRKATGLILALLLASPLAVAHTFNHYNQEVVCQTNMGPHGHTTTDGHKHAHNLTLAAAKGYVDHDPCKQTRMAYPDYHNATPLTEDIPPAQEIPLNQTLLPDGHTNHTHVFAGGEAYTLPVKADKVKVQSGLTITSDRQAAGMGFPGSGNFTHPYIIEGYVINGGNLVIKDTSACFDIRNNVIVSRAAPAPILPDPPTSITNLTDLIPYWNEINQTANNLRSHYLNLSRDWQDLNDLWSGNRTARDYAMQALNETLGNWFENETLWEEAFEAYEQRLLNAVEETYLYADDFQAYADDYNTLTPQPQRTPDEHINWAARQATTDTTTLTGVFEAYQQDLQDVEDPDTVEGWVYSNDAPATRPASFWGDDANWETYKQNYAQYQDAIHFYIDDFRNTVLPSQPDLDAYAQFQADFAAFQEEWEDAFADYKGFIAKHKAFKAQHAAFLTELNQVMADTTKTLNDAKAFFEKQAKYLHEYAGTLGTFAYNTADELLKYVLKLVYGILDPEDPNNAARNTGQLILDWNGQCIHAHNNVASDLRVNQNNDRTGFATGGTIERNRFFTIGQIRHYDGIFRDNEVGNRAIAVNLLKPSVVPLVGTERAVANDGFNQGWFFDNVIYGSFDSTLHGHHHSAGFFAPLSHYHGSDVSKERMYKDGVCTQTYGTLNQTRAYGPAKDYPRDSGVELLGLEVTQTPAHPNECLHHFDHGKRWTTLFFNHNVLIDPSGQGLRVNDRAHRANDEDANSENVDDLKAPHYHQKWWQVENNTVVGKIHIDRVNAPGTLLWSDDWEEVESSTGVDRTIEALDHPGAEIVTSHPYRNDIWVDLQRNHVFVTQPTGIVVDDGDMLTLLQLKENRGFGLPLGFNSNGVANFTRTTFIEWLKDVETRLADDIKAEMDLWGGTDRGVQTFVSLSDLRNGYRVEHCGNAARGLNVGLRAVDRIREEEGSLIDFVGVENTPCSYNAWGGANPDILIDYTPVANPQVKCTEDLRPYTQDTDDYYVTELLYDALDVVPASLCDPIPPPQGAPLAQAPAGPLPVATPSVISAPAPA